MSAVKLHRPFFRSWPPQTVWTRESVAWQRAAVARGRGLPLYKSRVHEHDSGQRTVWLSDTYRFTPVTGYRIAVQLIQLAVYHAPRAQTTAQPQGARGPHANGSVVACTHTSHVLASWTSQVSLGVTPRRGDVIVGEVRGRAAQTCCLTSTWRGSSPDEASLREDCICTSGGVNGSSPGAWCARRAAGVGRRSGM